MTASTLRSLGCSVLSVGMLALFGGGAPAEAGRDVAPFRVQVKVDGDDGIRTPLAGCLARGLSDITDVLVTDARPDYKLRIIAMAVVTASRKRVGFSVSVLVTAPYAERVESLAETYVPEESRPAVRGILSGAEEIVSHWIETGATGDAPRVCKSIVSSFERETLSKARVRRRPPPPHEGP